VDQLGTEVRGQIIDCHTHLTRYTFVQSRRNASWLPEENAHQLVGSMDGMGIGTSVVCGLGEENCEQNNDQLASIVAHHPSRLIGLASVHPRLPDEAATELERAVRGLGLKGLGEIGKLGYGRLDDLVFVEPLMAQAEEMGVPVLCHTGFPSPQCHPDAVGAIAQRHPHLKLIMAHFGLVFAVDAIEVALRHDNVWVDTSATVSFPSEFFEYAIRRIGAERVLWGSDWPLNPDVEMFKFLSWQLTTEEREKILWRNARMLFDLVV